MPRCARWVNLDEVDEAMRQYALRHDGYGPRPIDGDASSYGLSYLWKTVSSLMRTHHGTTLLRRTRALGLRVRGRNEELTLERIDAAMMAYAREHGRFPNQHCGLATKYVGIERRWSAIDSALRKMGSSLTRRASKLDPPKIE